MSDLDLTPVIRLTKDLKNAARTLSDDEARFLVDAYYSMQEDRIRAAHQHRTLAESGEPADVMSWLLDQREILEKQVARALDAYSAGQQVGVWARSIVGIGPVISAGLLAHIDIEKAPTVGHIWRYAGLDPTQSWEKGQKRPWNARLKTLCWKIGESFVKVSGNEKDIYGKVYKERKEIEAARNEKLEFAEQAKATLAKKRFGADTQAKKFYEQGMLPPAHVHARAKRYAVKLFLSHMHHVWWEVQTGEKPVKPYVLTHMGHAHYIAPPNWPMS